MSVKQPLMDLMDGAEDGTARTICVLNRSGISKVVMTWLDHSESQMELK